MDQKLQKMFQKSSYSISSRKYIYTKISKEPSSLIIKKCFMISRDSDEITAIIEKKYLGNLEIIEKNENLWRLISLNLETPFMAGTLAAVNSACAERGLNNLIVSTYSKDYIVVKDSQLQKICLVLQSLGFGKFIK